MSERHHDERLDDGVRFTLRQTDPGEISIASIETLDDGRRIPLTLRISPSNALWLAERIEAYLARRLNDRLEEVRGTDTLVVRPGGTDWEPGLNILHRTSSGDSKGSLWVGDPDATALAAALRAAAP